MRSYTNKEGEVIFVSQEHLDVAVQIKRELQMASPSHRTNWVTHQKLMEAEGFFDSESSENYRQMIKSYQVSTGTIESREKQADLVADSKLNSIKEAVGDLYYTKREVQMENLKLGRLKREITLFGVIAEQVREALLVELNEIIPTYVYQKRLESSAGRMVVLLSDWHIGATIDNVKGNSYNYKIAKKRIKKYLDRIKKIAHDECITDIDVVCMGDMTEHVSMRKVNQAHEAEFPLAVQIVKAYELIRDFIVNLSDEFNVTYRGIGGNHDRMNGDKGDNIDGDSTIFVINFMVKEFVENAGSERISYVEVDDINYSTSFEVAGYKMKFVHGDNEKGSKKLASHADIDNTSYNVLAMGHLHHHSVKEVGQNKYEVYVGSLQGANNYAMKGKFLSNASQGVIVVNSYGDIEIKRIELQNF
ncbi:metallophosphoesterase family protein [Paenibacillus alvei]|uniref:metallophosphoesterase family protein n=1 Tax=Paenibacillus alvei TaxID=44250 RepID=UPI00227EAD38|nr:metallophosphoesterase family protein [Paenibacillus alvei]MCY9758356.1 metallophosphoesterase family protein [Paenibacillus alvei]